MWCMRDLMELVEPEGVPALRACMVGLGFVFVCAGGRLVREGQWRLQGVCCTIVCSCAMFVCVGIHLTVRALYDRT